MTSLKHFLEVSSWTVNVTSLLKKYHSCFSDLYFLYLFMLPWSWLCTLNIRSVLRCLHTMTTPTQMSPMFKMFKQACCSVFPMDLFYLPPTLLNQECRESAVFLYILHWIIIPLIMFWFSPDWYLQRSTRVEFQNHHWVTRAATLAISLWSFSCNYGALLSRALMIGLCMFGVALVCLVSERMEGTIWLFCQTWAAF